MAMDEQKQSPSITFINNNNQDITTQRYDIEANNLETKNIAHHDCNWLEPALFAANNGLVSTASLMLGMGAVSQDMNAMIISGFLGLMAGACSSAIAEYISVDSALDDDVDGDRQRRDVRRDPLRAASAAASAFAVGAMVPLLIALILDDYNVTLGVVEGPISVVLAVFGWIGAFLDGAPGFRAVLRVLLWGWVGMVVTFGFLINSDW